MEDVMCISMQETDELYHHGIKGMRWGIRRYQNKDGSLTKAGKKRYDKEMGELKEEKKVLRNKIRTQKKMDKMSKLKSEVDDMKKEAEQEETRDAKRERLLKSTDPKELYKDRDVLTTMELNERINRIDTENRLQSKIVEEHVQTGMEKMNEKMDKWSNNVNKATNLYRSVDSAYSTVANSAIGKTLAKKLGIEPPRKEFNINDVWKKRNKMTDDELRKVSQRVQSEVNLKRNMDTLSGKNNNGNSKGMNETDVRNIVNQVLDERDNGGN